MKKTSEVLENMNHMLAKYAVRYEWYAPDSETDNRTTFEHDESEIIYSNTFKRMSNKSQIIVKPKRDHFRSRMVHTFEVREIALAIGKALKLNPGLISAIAMGHDLGHTPFGHAGERALQKIVRREAATYLDISTKTAPDKNWFHHASNSARILAIWLGRSLEEQEITKETIQGVARHSWSPWQKEGQNPIPPTYEAQAVAIADQLAGINHDTEDILNALDYIGITAEDLRRELTRHASKPNRTQIRNLADRLILDDESRAYGRKIRIEESISRIVDEFKKIYKNTDLSCKDAVEHPIPIPSDFGGFIRIYELAIRDIIHRETWFVGRDSMAEAMVTTVFNHFWPETKKWPIDSSVTGPYSASLLEGDTLKEQNKGSITERRYIDHFHDFFVKHYTQKGERQYDITKEKERIEDLGITTWSTFLYNKARPRSKKDIDNDVKKKLIRLIAIIDFISGLTDRYCLEIFDSTYETFLI